jgi:hypothetical protein
MSCWPTTLGWKVPSNSLHVERLSLCTKPRSGRGVAMGLEVGGGPGCNGSLLVAFAHFGSQRY